MSLEVSIVSEKKKEAAAAEIERTLLTTLAGTTPQAHNETFVVVMESDSGKTVKKPPRWVMANGS